MLEGTLAAQAGLLVVAVFLTTGTRCEQADALLLSSPLMIGWWWSPRSRPGGRWITEFQTDPTRGDDKLQITIIG